MDGRSVPPSRSVIGMIVDRHVPESPAGTPGLEHAREEAWPGGVQHGGASSRRELQAVDRQGEERVAGRSGHERVGHAVGPRVGRGTARVLRAEDGFARREWQRVQ